MLTPAADGRGVGTLFCPTTGAAVFHVEQFPHPAPRLPVPIPTGTARARAAGTRPLTRAVSVVRHVAAWPLLGLLWTYRRVVSPALPPACRYHPSCSEYAFQAIAVHGPVRGFWLALRRLLRCHPWAPGGPDPVPAAGALDRERGDR